MYLSMYASDIRINKERGRGRELGCVSSRGEGKGEGMSGG